MKHLAKLCFISCVLMALVACGDRNAAEQRADFVGEYDFRATGNVEMRTGSTQIASLPLDENGTFVITEANAPDEVMLVGYNDTIYATVAGQYLLLESTTTNMDYNGVNLQLTFLYGKAKLENNQLSWHTDVIGTATYGVMSASGSGEIEIVATKNQ